MGLPEAAIRGVYKPPNMTSGKQDSGTLQKQYMPLSSPQRSQCKLL